jgi:Fur family transcriptional regulator, stress-responsive regulator
MALETQSDTDRRLVSKLRARGLRVTSQRLLIHRTLFEGERHMTAEQVLAAVSRRLPGVSLPTVYATLELLEDLGLARRLATGNGPVLFDARSEPHAHAVCRRCGAAVDLQAPPAPPRAFADARRSGFAPDHAQLVIWGLCGSCAAGARTAA